MAKSPERKDAERKASERKDAQRKDADEAGGADGADGPGAKNRRGAPGIVAPSNRVNVAFPFAKIELEEPSKELAELADLVHDLVVAMGEWVPDDRFDELETRARAVRDSLR